MIIGTKSIYSTSSRFLMAIYLTINSLARNFVVLSSPVSNPNVASKYYALPV